MLRAAGVTHNRWTLPSCQSLYLTTQGNVVMQGTPLVSGEALDTIDFVRTIAVARITMPKSYVRLSAGRGEMSDELQALCFLAGANSIFYGDKLLTTGNPDVARDQALLQRLGLRARATGG